MRPLVMIIKKTFIMYISLVPTEMAYFVYCYKSVGDQVSLKGPAVME